MAEYDNLLANVPTDLWIGGKWKKSSDGARFDVIDPATGKVDFSFPWRSRTHDSVNASCPVVFDNKVFVSASYRTGSALVEVRPDFTHRVVWTTRDVGLHVNTAVYSDGYI